MRNIQVILPVLLLVIAGVQFLSAATVREQRQLTIYLFAQEGCPHCAGAKRDLTELTNADPAVELQVFTLGNDQYANRWFAAALKHFQYSQAAVPLVVIGDRSFLGYRGNGHSRAEYKTAIGACIASGCEDVVVGLAFSAQPQTTPTAPLPGTSNKDPPARSSRLPTTVAIPFLRELETKDLSLPLLTLVLAAVDGFNPCAMWVLVFLIGLLLGVADRTRMWILGAAFLIATALMYFSVMAAWLNLILFLDTVVWVRAAVGLLAIGGGLFFLREHWTKPEGVCRITNARRQTRIMEAFQFVVSDSRMVLPVIGIMALAVLVNFIELLCSAGIPAVYTQVLALSDLPTSGYYGYLGLYIAVFMLDDIAIFVTAMVALQVSGLTGQYARWSHLIGGILLLAIGAVLLLKPELLSIG